MSKFIPCTLLENFALGMDRVEAVKSFYHFPPLGTWLNLGAGNKHIEGAVSLDADNGWLAPYLDEYIDNSVQGIYAYHFFEHLSKNDLIVMLRECERVLHPGRCINFLVPYYSSQIAFMDIDHKLFFNEKTFPTIFQNKYYSGTRDNNEWALCVHMQMIMGLEERNVALVGQLIKGETNGAA